MSDIEIGVRPHVVSDFRTLPYRDSQFDQIYFDPPHLIRKSNWSRRQVSMGFSTFGKWATQAEWHSALKAADAEFARVAKPSGTLYVKIVDGDGKSATTKSDLSILKCWQPVSERRIPPKTPWSKADVLFVQMIRKG